MEFGWSCLLKLCQFPSEESKEILKKTQKGLQLGVVFGGKTCF